MAENPNQRIKSLGKWTDLDDEKRKSIVKEIYDIKPFRGRRQKPDYYSQYVADKYGVYVEPNHLRTLVSRYRKTVWNNPARSIDEFEKNGKSWQPIDKEYVSLGLDVATRTGWAVFKNKDLVNYGTITCGKGDDNFIAYYKFFYDKIIACKPDYVFIENIYNSNNVTYRSLLLKHGLIYTACINAFAAVGLIGKSKVVWLNAGWIRGKVGIPGKNRESLKINSCKWANENFGTDFKYNADSQLTDDDKADAIAVCYAGITEVFNGSETPGSTVKRKRHRRSKRKVSKALRKRRNNRNAKRNVRKSSARNSKAGGGRAK